MSDKYRKLVKDFIIVSLGSFGSKILSFLMIPLYTSVLSTSDYGNADLILTTVNLIYPILTLSIAEAVVRFVLQKDGNDKQYISISIYLWLIGVVVMAFFTPAISTLFFEGKYIFLILLSYITCTINIIIGQYVRGKNELMQYSISGIIGSIVYLTCNIIFLLMLNFGLIGYIMSSIISSCLSVIYLIIKMKIWRDVISPALIERSIFYEMISYSLPLAFNAISWWIVMSSDKYILLFFEGSSSNGIYTVAQKLPSLLVTITSLFLSAWQISSVNDFGSNESEKFFSEIFSKYQSFLFLVSAILITCEKMLAKIMFSVDFYVAWRYLAVLLLANIFYAAVSFLGTVYMASKNTRASLYTTIIGAIINIILNVLLIPYMGIMGACVATTISYYLVMVIRVINIRKSFNLRFEWIKYTLQYAIMIFQGLIMQIDSKVSYGICICLMLVIFIINKKFVKEIIDVVRRRFFL